MHYQQIIGKMFSILVVGSVLLGGTESFAGGELAGITYKAVCRAPLPVHTVWNTPEGTGEIALVAQTQTSHNVWQPNAGQAIWSGAYQDDVCSFTCEEGYAWDATDQTCRAVCDTTVACDSVDITINDGINSYTMKACNVGASAAGTGSASYGCYFQRGNNYGFVNTGIVGPASTGTVDASTYGPSQYTSNIFRYGNTLVNTSPYDRTSPSNKNLRGGSGDTLSSQGTNYIDRQGPCPVGYHIPSIGERGGVITARHNLNLSDGTYNNSNPSNGPYILRSALSLAKFQNDLNIPLAGLRGADNLSGVGAISVVGMYWSSSPQEPTTPNNYSLNLLFNSSQVQLYYMGNRRHNAMSIRCFKD